MPPLLSSSSSSSSPSLSLRSLHTLLAVFLLVAVVLPFALLWTASLFATEAPANERSMSTANRVLGYVIFHRHGHRAPARNVLSSSFDKTVASPEELSLWLSMMPSESLLRRITTPFKLDIHDDNPIEPDRLNFPFGSITTKGDRSFCINLTQTLPLHFTLLYFTFDEIGINHLIDVGIKIGKRFPLIKKANQVDIVATNYQRTQLSAQAMLTGLGLEDTSTRNLKVQVRDIQQCAMSFYEGNPHLVTRLFKEAQTQEDFHILEEHMASISTSLIKEFPLMVRKDSNINSNNSSGGKIDWLAAFDYFACREAHNLPISDNLDNNTAYGELVKEHMAKRVSLYLASGGEHVSLAAGPLLRDIKRSTDEIFTRSDIGENENVDVHVYSGHDVNILALLYAIGADSKLVSPPFWPDYGSNVVVEVHQGGSLKLYYELEPLKIRNANELSSESTDFVSTISIDDLRGIMDMIFLGEDEHLKVLQEHRHYYNDKDL